MAGLVEILQFLQRTLIQVTQLRSDRSSHTLYPGPYGQILYFLDKDVIGFRSSNSNTIRYLNSIKNRANFLESRKNTAY